MLRERLRLRIIHLNRLCDILRFVDLNRCLIMKRRRDAKNKTTWEDFEQRVGLKRTGGDKNGKRSTKNAPSDILVQRMSSTASGRLKKYEPLDTRNFVPFGDYDELSIDNIKDACE